MRMIERWFPCAEVSEATTSGWGSAKSEKALFVWFATRPLAQAKAAVLTSLLPWPDQPAEQRRLQDLVRRALTGYDAAHRELIDELAK
jgi:putative DNA methylase